MPRLFIGSFLSEQAVAKVNALALGNNHLEDLWHTNIRWVSSDKLHMTWLFLGDTPSDLIDELKTVLNENLQNIERGDLALHYDRFELWPNERTARLGVLTPSLVPDIVFELDERLKKGFEPYLGSNRSQHHERQTFQPHITVFRFPRHNRPATQQGRIRMQTGDVSILEGLFPIEHAVTQIHLIESDLGKSIQGYTTLASFELVHTNECS